MPDDHDPIQMAVEDDDIDLYDITNWEPRTVTDRFSTFLYHSLHRAARILTILIAILILVVLFLISGFAVIINPLIGAFVILSIIPAFLITYFVWRADITIREPLPMLITTFILGVLFAGFAAVFNSIARPFFAFIPYIGLILFFYLIVGPIEETVKWLAIRLYAFRHPTFQTVLDGAVYGAAAGLGFATIENTLYISQHYLATLQSSTITVQPLQAVLPVALSRTLAGPGHVLYSAFAGYYLGLAKFNPESAGPIVIKGLFLAAMVHATYNALVSILPLTILTFIGFIIVYDGLLGYIIYRKINRYRHYYQETNAANFIRNGRYTSAAVDHQPSSPNEPATPTRNQEDDSDQ